MKDVRFYLEFPDAQTKKKSGKSNNGHAGNVFAGFINVGPTSGRMGYQNHNGVWVLEGLGAVHDYANSPVACCTANVRTHLRAKCKRVPEKVARKIHPRLFERLDAK